MAVTVLSIDHPSLHGIRDFCVKVRRWANAANCILRVEMRKSERCVCVGLDAELPVAFSDDGG